ncbi:hypothetical protein GCM10022267_91010 [Lentzea roselyniae]|uniref:Uncharacterized protein n=1 Tax=Lentzea roselyniae TaxID=531940 RepID=A0ABP7CKD5_9PSEU
MRATKSRRTEITQYIEGLDADLGRLLAEAETTEREVGELAQAVDAAANEAISPFLSRRDDLMRQQQFASAQLDQARTAIKMLDRPRFPRTGGTLPISGISWVPSLQLPPVRDTARGMPCPS